MSKYIELPFLLEGPQATGIATDDLCGMEIMSNMNAAGKVVTEQPIIDAESVVRHRYCKHHNEGENYIHCRVLETKCPDGADFFCVCGEKESGN